MAVVVVVSGEEVVELQVCVMLVERHKHNNNKTKDSDIAKQDLAG